MIYKEERVFKTLYRPHVSEKASSAMEKYSTLVFKVDINATKREINFAVRRLFEVKIHKIRTLVIKGKVKRQGQQIGSRKNWKKAYIIFKKDQNLNISDIIK